MEVTNAGATKVHQKPQRYQLQHPKPGQVRKNSRLGKAAATAGATPSLGHSTGAINSLRTQLSDNQKMLDDAAAELAKWNDPEYVASQARARLHFIFPGERQYIIIGNGEITEGEQETKVSEQLPIGLPWYSRLISSITSTNVNG